jgi:alpha-mannosidase
MVDTLSPSPAQLHIITYLDWQREGQNTFDNQRAKLLDILAQLLIDLQASDEKPQLEQILLGGQTIILDDVASIASHLVDALASHSRNKKLALGPWYIHLDGLMADGEALVRSLLLGQLDTARYNIPKTTVAFMPESCQNIAQLPQILRNFDIDAVFLCLASSVMQLPFRWEAPDGSHVLVMNYQEREDLRLAVIKQRSGQPDGPFLWMHQIISPETLLSEAIHTEIDTPKLQSSLEDYTAVVREKLPDDLRPSVKGELHLKKDFQTMGRFSAQVSHKQELVRLQARLSYLAEPLLALSLTRDQVRFPEIQCALLEYSWRLLMQNMSRQTFAGAVSDAVYDEMIIRNRRVYDNSQRVIENALNSLPGTNLKPDISPTATEETYITVWNLHGHLVKQVVELPIRLPEGKHPNILLDPNGEELTFSWDSEARVLGFKAEVASVGYAVYTLKLSQDKTAAYNQKRTVAGRVIGSASGESLGLVSGRLDWTFDSNNIIDLLSFHDGGDAGDIWQYQEPEPDVVMQGGIVDVAQVEATPTYERLIFRHRMRVAPSLKNGKERERGLRVLDLTTSATYYNDLPGVYFQTSFTNTAEDHRLRAHIRTGIEAHSIYSDTAFGLVKHPVPQTIGTGEHPMQSLAALYDEQRGLALFTRGLNAFEPVQEQKQVTLALTLLRAVGKLDKHHKISSTHAQMPGDHLTEFILMPVQPERDLATLLRHSLSYRAPLYAAQYQEKPPKNTHSYLQLTSDKVVMTALKPPQQGKGLIVRLLNAGRVDTGISIKANDLLKSAARSNLAEVKQADLEITNHEINLSLEPHQIVTLHLEF